MILLLMLIPVAIYIIIAIIVYFSAVKKKNAKIKAMYIVFISILPTWDFILSLSIYGIVTTFWCGVDIGDMVYSNSFYTNAWSDVAVEIDNQIYYNKLQGTLNGFDNIKVKINVIKRGKKRVPVDLVCKLTDNSSYRPENYLLCDVENDSESKYMVLKAESKIINAKIIKISIVHSRTGHVIGESRFATTKLAFPFFDWLGWNKFAPSSLVSAPFEFRHDFAFQVISPIQVKQFTNGEKDD